MNLGDLLLLVVGPLTRRGGASGCVHAWIWPPPCGRCSAGFPLLPTTEEEEDGGGGEGSARGGRRICEWRRGARPAVVVGEEGNGEWEEKGNQKSVGLDLGLRTLCVHMSWWVDSSSAGSYPSLLLWHVPGGHGRDHLVVARAKNPRYYYQLSSSEG